MNGRNEIKFEFTVNAQPLSSAARLYRGYISYKKTWLWLIPVQVTLTNKNYYANPATLPYDYYPGGEIRDDFDPQSSTVKNWFIKYNVTASHIQSFCFIPVPSALDIGRGSVTLAHSDYLARYIGIAPPAPPTNTPFQNYITAFDATASNEDHIDILQRNGDWVAAQLNQSPQSANCGVLCSATSLTGNSLICTSQLYQIPGLITGGGTTVIWSASPLGIVTIAPSTDGSQATISKYSTGDVTITATIFACGQSVTVSKIAHVGGYGSSDYPVTGPGSSCKNSYVTYSTNTLPGAANYNWFYPAGGTWAYVSGQNTPGLTLITGNANGTFQVGVRVANAFDAGGSAAVKFTNINCGRFALQASPNPTSGDITVNTKVEALSKSPVNKIYKIRGIDQIGNTRKSFNFSGKNTLEKIKLSALNKGVYQLSVYNGEEWSNKIILE